MPKRVLSPSADALSLSDMPEHLLERLALELSPPDAFAFVSTSKRLFWNSRGRGAGALGVRILQAALKRHLDALLEGITSPSADSVDSQGRVKRKRNALSCEDLFPPHLVVSGRGEKPQVLLSGSLAVQSVLGISPDDEKWSAADVDIFCTWRAAEFVRERLMAKNMICSGVDNTYRQEGRDLNGDFEHSAFAVISHVESYAARPKTGVTGEYGDYIAYDSDAYYAKARAWGATAVANMPKFASVGDLYGPGIPGGSAGGDFLYDYDLRDESYVQLIVGKPRVTDARELLESFDLEICKSYFDGNTFHVPAARDSFAGRTKVTPARRALVEEFMRKREKVRLERGVRERARQGHGERPQENQEKNVGRYRRYALQRRRRGGIDVPKLVRFPAPVSLPHQAHRANAEVRQTGRTDRRPAAGCARVEHRSLRRVLASEQPPLRRKRR
jgi:hypothetical protein